MQEAVEAAEKAKNDAAARVYKDLIDSLLLHYGTTRFGPEVTKAHERLGYAKQTLRDAVARLAKIQSAQEAGARFLPSLVDRAYGGTVGRIPTYSKARTVVLLPLFVSKFVSKLKADGVDKPTRDGFEKLLVSLDMLLLNCWTQKNIRAGWQMFRNITPQDYDPILKSSVAWDTLTERQKQRVRDAIPALAMSISTNNGLVDETLMTNMLGDILEDYESDAAEEEEDSDATSSDSDSSAGSDVEMAVGGATSSLLPPKKALPTKVLIQQRAVVVSSPAARYFIDMRAQHKLLKLHWEELKALVSKLPVPPPPRTQAAPPSSSTSSTSSSSSSSSAAGPQKPTTAPAGNSNAPAKPLAGVVKSMLKKICENSNCGVASPCNLVRCKHCWMTFCGECSTPQALGLHHQSNMCKKKSNRV